MRLEELSDIDSGENEWKIRKKPVYHRLRIYFFLHELLMNSKFLLMMAVVLLLQQPSIQLWVSKLLWQFQYLVKNIFFWIIPL